MSPGRHVLGLVVLAAIVHVSSVTRAEQPGATPPAPSAAPADPAADLKKRGDEAMDSLRYDEALSLYQAAYRSSHDPAVLYNMGRIYLARAEFPEALESLERFLAEAPADLQSKVPGIADLVAQVRAKVATVSIACNVPGARVSLRGRSVGTTPLAAPMKVAAGDATLEITKDGYQPYRRDVALAGGAESVVDAVLVALPRRAILAVHTGDDPATIVVDGKPAGRSPLELSVDAGQHVIVGRREGRPDAETTAVVGGGERKDVGLVFPSTPGLLTRWWFWTGVGVVLAGGVAATYALLTEKKASTGENFQPGQVAGPLLRW